jgi:diguanylate cyclase (GGDEF)-like protein
LKAILTDTVEAFRGVLKCDDISIAKIDELNNQGTVMQSTYIKENSKFSLEEGLVGMISKHRNVILKDDLSHGDLFVLKKGEKRNRGSFVGVPVKENDDVIGVIWLEDHRKKRFGEDDMRALNILASQLTLAWQRANLHEKVKERSERDGLTGLYNHRHFQEVLESEIEKKKEFILLFFDIDYFKKINDNYGHQAGDEVLKFLGRLIGQTGIAGRYGGEEFAIILPGHSLKKGVEVAVHLKDHINKSEVRFNQLKIKFTISVGIAHFPKDARTRTDLIEMADRALYSAKKTGRDKIVIAKSLFANTQGQARQPGVRT